MSDTTELLTPPSDEALAAFDQAQRALTEAIRFCHAAFEQADKAKIPLAACVDRLGIIKAQLATIGESEEALKTRLAKSGKPRIDGELFYATISEGEQARLDMDAVREKLSPQFIAAHTNRTPFVRVDVRSRRRV
jgi:hypothetical protein